MGVRWAVHCCVNAKGLANCIFDFLRSGIHRGESRRVFDSVNSKKCDHFLADVCSAKCHFKRWLQLRRGGNLLRGKRREARHIHSNRVSCKR